MKKSKVTIDQLADIVNGKECLFKVFEENALKYANCLLETGCLHLSSLQTFREAEGSDRDENDGLVLANLQIANFKVFENNYIYNSDRQLFIIENDPDISYNTKLLDNYILCMSCHLPNSETAVNREMIPVDDLRKIVKCHGKYVVVISNWIEFIKRLIKAKNKPCRLIASSVVEYVDTHQLNIFSKRSEYANEHEYRFAFDLTNEKPASLNMSIGSIADLAEIYEVVLIRWKCCVLMLLLYIVMF